MTITSQIQSTRDYLDRADRFPLTEQQIGSLIVAVSTLADVVEHLSKRVADLERVQNDRAAD